MGAYPFLNAAKKANVEAYDFLLNYKTPSGFSMADRLKEGQGVGPGAENYNWLMLGSYPTGALVEKALAAGADPNEVAVLSGLGKTLCGIGRGCKTAGLGADSFMLNFLSSLEGSRPLHQASESGNVGVLAALLAGGADPRLRNAMGETPLDLAARKGQRRCADLLRADLEKWPAPVTQPGFCGQESLPEATPALLRRIRAEHGKKVSKRASKDTASTNADSDTASTAGSAPAEMWV